jgi:hypothetical protein
MGERHFGIAPMMTFPRLPVRRVQARRMDVHDYLTGAREWVWCIAILEYFRAAVAVHQNCLHPLPPFAW